MSDTDLVRATRQAIAALHSTLDARNDALIPTSRGLEAIVDRRFLTEMSRYRWYAVIGRGHIYAVSDIAGRRIALQRFAYQLANPQLTFDEVKHVSFINKITFDCRLGNLANKVGRQAVMRNKRGKRNSSSEYKGVIASVRPDGTTVWRTQIKADFGSMSIGSYDDEVQAAKAYDVAAILFFGGSALLNFPGLVPDAETMERVTHQIARRREWLRQKARKAGRVDDQS
jgi:hypothetical protein